VITNLIVCLSGVIKLDLKKSLDSLTCPT